MTLEKQVFWQNTRALRMTAAVVQSEWSSFLVCSHDAAITSPFEFRMRKPTPTNDLDQDWDKARFNLNTESKEGGDYLLAGVFSIVELILLISINSITYTETRDHKPSEQGDLFSKLSLLW